MRARRVHRRLRSGDVGYTAQQVFHSMGFRARAPILSYLFFTLIDKELMRARALFFFKSLSQTRNFNLLKNEVLDSFNLYQFIDKSSSIKPSYSVLI